MTRTSLTTAWPCVALLLAVLVSGARAQSPAGGSQAGRSHGWFILNSERTVGDETQTIASLYHLPPRSMSPDGTRGAIDGALRSVMSFRGIPEALACREEEVFIAFSARSPDARGQRTVLSLRALPAAFAGQWFYEPLGRLTPHPSLPARGTLIGLASLPQGLAALLFDDTAEADAAWRLLLLAESAWREVPLPTAPISLPRARVGVRLLTLEGTLGILDLSDDPPRIWRADLEVAVDTPSTTASPTDPNAPLPKASVSVGASWSLRPLAHRAHLETEPLAAIGLGESIFLVTPGQDGSTNLVALDGDREHLIAVVEGLPATEPPASSSLACVPLRDVSRLVVAWRDDSEVSGATPRLLEISTVTGRVLYEGPGLLEGPVSPREFRLLAVGLFLIMVLVLIFLLRRDPVDGIVRIPAGHALLAPLPRAAATAIDLLLAGIGSSAILDVPLQSVFTLAALSSEVNSEWGLILTIAIGLTCSTCLEALTGTSPGKFLMRARVCPLGEQVRRPSLRAAAVRNACKWLVPPLAIALVWDPNLRHRGDVLAGVLVISARPVAPTSPPDQRG